MNLQIKILKSNLRKFLNSCVIDPNDKKEPLLKIILEEATVHQLELKAMEYLIEAGRIRNRIGFDKRADSTLLEFYQEKLRLSATYISLAAEKQQCLPRPIDPKDEVISSIPRSLKDLKDVT